MTDNDQLLDKIGTLMDQKLGTERDYTRKLVREEIKAEIEPIKKDMVTKAEIEPINKRLDAQSSSIAQIKTVVELTEETVNNMDEALKEVVQDHRERIERLEKETSTLSHKN